MADFNNVGFLIKKVKNKNKKNNTTKKPTAFSSAVSRRLG